MTPEDIARRIDHSLLHPEAVPRQVDALCKEALEYGFAAVFVNPCHVRRAADRLAAHGGVALPHHIPTVGSVAGFPLGASKTDTKADEARRAIDDGATEVDMVAALGALADGDGPMVRKDIEAVARTVHQRSSPAILKVILETAALSTEQIVLGCRCAVEAGADFVKTSTGFHPRGGATVEHIRLLCRHAAPLRVKASGGIRTATGARAMLDAGAARIGTSAGVAIIKELRP